jgi:hypothetical protein
MCAPVTAVGLGNIQVRFEAKYFKKRANSILMDAPSLLDAAHCSGTTLVCRLAIDQCSHHIFMTH